MRRHVKLIWQRVPTKAHSQISENKALGVDGMSLASRSGRVTRKTST
jgi:hypothetical protein